VVVPLVYAHIIDIMVSRPNVSGVWVSRVVPTDRCVDDPVVGGGVDEQAVLKIGVVQSEEEYVVVIPSNVVGPPLDSVGVVRSAQIGSGAVCAAKGGTKTGSAILSILIVPISIISV